ncbi:MAG: hypothetical protein V4704_05085 [Pseudomonadota bacterium]
MPFISAGIAPIAPGFLALCIPARGLSPLERLKSVGVASLFGKALRGVIVTLLATFKLVRAFPVAFDIGIAQVRLAALPLFNAFAAVIALQQYLVDALLAGLCFLHAVGVLAPLLPSQVTCNLPLGLLAHVLPGLLALLGLLLGRLLALLLGLPLALLLAQFLARAAVVFVLGGILRAGEGIGSTAHGNHRHEQGNGKAAGSEKAVHVMVSTGRDLFAPARAVGGCRDESRLRIFTLVGLA